jgi:predicted transcriptional regulator of viral defense system
MTDIMVQQLAEISEGGFFRPRDLEALGMHRSQLPGLVKRGIAERVSRGLYRLTSGEVTESFTVAAVCARVPQAIVCLLSALQIHGIGTQNPHEVWIALDRKARKPRIEDLPVRIVRFSGPALHYGVQALSLQGVPTRITSPARTVVDCFRYRNQIGLDVALEALRETLRGRHVSVEEILRTAEACRARTVVLPYLEALVA